MIGSIGSISRICFMNLMHLSISFWLSTGDLGTVFSVEKTHHQGRFRKTRSGVMGGWDHRFEQQTEQTAAQICHQSQRHNSGHLPEKRPTKLLLPKIEGPETRSRHLPGSWDKTGRNSFADSFLWAQLVDTTLLVTLISWLRKKYPQCYGFHPFPSHFES